MPDGVRAFAGLKMAPEVEQAVADIIESMRVATAAHRGGIRWTSHNRLHLTLRFLGDAVTASRLERLDGALDEIATATACFDIEVCGIGAFPNLSQPRVLWIGLESSELSALASRIEDAAVAVGLAPEQRVFAPHLTIARIGDLAEWRGIQRAVEIAMDRSFGWSAARDLILYRSIFGPGAPVYEELGRYPLARANSP